MGGAFLPQPHIPPLRRGSGQVESSSNYREERMKKAISGSGKGLISAGSTPSGEGVEKGKSEFRRAGADWPRDKELPSDEDGRCYEPPSRKKTSGQVKGMREERPPAGLTCTGRKKKEKKRPQKQRGAKHKTLRKVPSKGEKANKRKGTALEAEEVRSSVFPASARRGSNVSDLEQVGP